MNKQEIEDVSKKTGIPIKQLNRLNKEFWYHGTTKEKYEILKDLGPIANYNEGYPTDFGAGFYLMESFDRAKSYIIGNTTINGVNDSEKCIIKYRLDICELLFKGNEQYTYKNFPSYNAEFAEYILDTRINIIKGLYDRPYDVVWGVMSDSYPDAIVDDLINGKISREEAILKLQKSTSSRQLFISNQTICNMLVEEEVTVVRKEEN